jgi:hypothetical protein
MLGNNSEISEINFLAADTILMFYNLFIKLIDQLIIDKGEIL